MGQYWRIINLDKKETSGSLGKLGESFFHSPQYYIFFLTIPPNPSSDPRVGSWAGDRIICVGDYIRDYPAGALTDGELEELDEMNLYHVASEEYDRVQRHDYVPEDFDGATEWVLRNLSKGEYVRSDVLADCRDKEGVEGSGSHRLKEVPGLAQVLLANISWSSDPSAAMRSYKKELTRGSWAGDRLDVVPANTFDATADETREWVDVSEEMAKEVIGLYQYEFYWVNKGSIY